jgi:hypothetical protein
MFSKKAFFMIPALLALFGLSVLPAGGQRSGGQRGGRTQIVLWHTYSDHHTRALIK